jgi:hypothetical protein
MNLVSIKYDESWSLMSYNLSETIWREKALQEKSDHPSYLGITTLGKKMK